ncbi:phytosulfokine receptor 1-like protein [Tanacetum coccineum]
MEEPVLIYILKMVLVFEKWLFVSVILLSLQCRVLVTAQNLKCDPYDLRGLMGLVYGLDSPVDGWWFTNASSSCCDWAGITCDASSGRIVKLDLANKRLSGIFNASVSNLDQLKTLNLSHNSLKGPLPVSLFYLALLEEVDLSGNFFDEVLPVSVNLPALQVLDVSDNNLRGYLPRDLCVNSNRIRFLSFGFNYFTGVMPLQYKDCHVLEHLSVASNYISGVIPDFLFTLSQLQELALEDNEFTNFTKVSNVSSSLVRLDVSLNRISGNIPDFFHSFPNLNYFSAHSNNLSGVVPL